MMRHRLASGRSLVIVLLAVALLASCSDFLVEAKDELKTVSGKTDDDGIKPVAVEGITVEPDEVSVEETQTAQLTATITPADAANNTVSWSTSDDTIATVDATGLVRGLSAGKATITATAADGGFAATCTVTVTKMKIALDMVLVPGGTFDNGTSNMTVSTFYIGTAEVTQRQYADVTGSVPSSCATLYGLGDTCPVYFVSWLDAVAFCNALSAQHGYDAVYAISGSIATADFSRNGYRLPTEAEWQYAARGGTASLNTVYAGGNAIGDVAWYSVNSSSTAHVVGGRTPNELGIFDMSGNVREWCHDWYGVYPPDDKSDYAGADSGSSRVVRGGSWSDNAPECAVSYRDSESPSYTGLIIGFRVVRRP